MSGEVGRWRATYTPGSWLLLCGPAAAVVLEPADPSWTDLVETLWDEVVAAESIADVAARLAWYRIDSMPSFAAFFWGPDGMRSLVRGAVKVVDAVSGDVVATGEGVQTWVETGLGDLRQVQVQLPTEPPEGVFPLPLVVGAVGVSAVFLDATDESTLSSPQQQDAGQQDVGQQAAGQQDAAKQDPEALAGTTPEQVTVEPPEGVTPDEPEQLELPEEDTEPGAPEPMPLEVAEPTARTEHENAETRLVAIPELFADTPGGLPAVGAGPTVLAVSCSWGHPNPPGAARCRVCEGLIPAQSPRAIDPPAVAVLRASNGATVDVVGSVLVGRAPSADRARVEHPALLTVTSPSHDISRTHLEVFAAGWDVGVTDLHSTNGTVLVAPDGSFRTMDPGETAGVQLGTSLELADGISVLIDYPQ